MLYDTHRTDLLPHIMTGRSARSTAWRSFFNWLRTGTGQQGQAIGGQKGTAQA